MSDNNLNQLFQERFEGFEANVDPSVWAAVENQIAQPGTAPTDGGAAGSATSSGISGTTIAVATIGTAALVTLGVYLFSNNEKATTTPEVPELAEELPVVLEEATIEEVPVEREETTSTVQEAHSTLEETPVEESAQPAEQISDQAAKVETQTPVQAPPTPIEVETQQADDAVVDPVGDEQITVQPSEETSQPTPEAPVEVDPPVEALSANIQSERVEGMPYTYKFNNSGESAFCEWDMGDGQRRIENSPEHTFNGPGEYTVQLTAKARDGREVINTMEVLVFAPSELTLPPNVLTPNGDHTHDSYNVEGKHMKQMNIKVFNVGGDLIYTSDSFEIDWDGNDQNGRPMPAGQYPVVIEAKGLDGKTYLEKIFVTLIR